MQNNLIISILEKIERKEWISPFLFLWQWINEINQKVDEISSELAIQLWISNNYIYVFKDNLEKIKVENIKEFLEKVFIVPSFWAQIFIIENISRMTDQSANSCLKIFEEAPFWNIIFLTNESESSILETILSRCTSINLNSSKYQNRNEKYYNMIDDYVRWIDHDLASFVFKEKLEKEEYIKILKTMILYFKEKHIFLDMIWEINEDLNWIQKNNVLAKYIVDKYIFKIMDWN